MRRALLSALILCLTVLPTFAQEQDTWYVGKPISDIRFEGLENVSRNDLSGVIEPFIGEKFENSLFYDLQSKLYALDYFESFSAEAEPATPERNEVVIVFSVIERPLVDSIEIEGNRFVRDTDLLDEILLKEGDMVTKSKVQADVESIRSLYLEKGFPNVEVEGEIEEVSEKRSNVVFSIDEGARTKVKEILFSGNNFASDSTLKRLLSTKEQSLFASGAFQESKIAEDIQAIEEYYWDRGYVDAEVVNVDREVEEAEDQNNLFLTFYIEEGKQYTYGGMTFEGNELYSDERLQEAVRQIEEKGLSKTKLEADFARVSDIYSSNGYIFNSITREEIRDEENRTISYEVKIVERGRAHIENIILQGNEKTEDYVIKRELPFEVGDIFSAQHIRQANQNLSNLQYFSTVEPNVVIGSADGLVDVILNLEEGRTTDINFGLTFSGATADFPIIGFFKWTDNNFRGMGQEFSIGTEVSSFTQSLTFSFRENWLFGRRWSAGIDLSAEHSLTTGEPQDFLAPVFSADDPNAVPDPYDGSYVWSEDAPDSNKAGQPYDDTEAELSDYLENDQVVTDYEYAVSQDSGSIDSSYLMDYDSYDVSLGVSTGYTFRFPQGRLGTSTRLSTTLSYVDYDRGSERPFDAETRNNYRTLRPITKWLLNATWDTRNLSYNPTEGYYLRQGVTFAGGFLPSSRDYVKTDTKAQGYITLFDVPVFENWNLKGVLAGSTSLSFVLNPFIGDYSASTNDLLYIDGMTTARGWPRTFNGRALWNNWLELRIPIVEQTVWWDFFFDGVGFWSETEDFISMGIEDYRFGFGGGARLTIPGLPIGLYLAKRFKFDSSGVIEWQGGTVLSNDDNSQSGLDFVISFTTDLF